MKSEAVFSSTIRGLARQAVGRKSIVAHDVLRHKINPKP